MGAVAFRGRHSGRTVAQTPLCDAAKGIACYNSVRPSWTASRRPCNECLPGDADHLADLQVFRLGLREMGAVGLRELHPAHTVAQEPLGDAAKGIPRDNGVGSSWTASRRPCTECLSDSVSPSAALIQCKLPTHDTTKLGAELGFQGRDNVLDHIVESDVPFVRTCIGNKGAHQQFLCPCNGGNAL